MLKRKPAPTPPTAAAPAPDLPPRRWVDTLQGPQGLAILGSAPRRPWTGRGGLPPLSPADRADTDLPAA